MAHHHYDEAKNIPDECITVDWNFLRTLSKSKLVFRERVKNPRVQSVVPYNAPIRIRVDHLISNIEIAMVR